MISNSVVTVYGFLVLLLPAESLLWRLVVAMDLVIVLKPPHSIGFMCHYHYNMQYISVYAIAAHNQAHKELVHSIIHKNQIFKTSQKIMKDGILYFLVAGFIMNVRNLFNK